VRYRYTFDIVSQVALADPTMRFSHDGFSFELRSPDRRLIALAVETPTAVLPQDWKEQARAKLEREAKPEEKDLPILVSPPEPFFAAVQHQVRIIRGALCLWGVTDINTMQPAIEYLPDSPREEADLDLLGVNLKRQSRSELPLLRGLPDMIVRCILARAEFDQYEIPLEFYRRGCDDCYNQEFVEAIYDFYFVLEFLFGGGQTKATPVERAFASEPALRKAITEAESGVSRAANEGENWAKRSADKYGGADSTETIKKIVRLRGFLHHQSQTRRENWNPGSPTEYEPDAHFLRLICQSVLLNLGIRILFGPDAMRQFQQVPVFGTDGRLIYWRPQTR
jgi:hypothetical protein